MAQSWQSQSEGSPEREGTEQGITPSPSFEGGAAEEKSARVEDDEEEVNGEDEDEGQAAGGMPSIYDVKKPEQKGLDLSDTESLVEDTGQGRTFT